MIDEKKAIKSLKVVIVDDEKAYRMLIKKIIVKYEQLKFYAGYNSAEDFISSLDSLSNVPDVCIMDVNLKNMSGIECIKKVKINHPDIYFIVITAHLDLKVLAEIKELGIDYLEKGKIVGTLANKIISAKTTFFEKAI